MLIAQILGFIGAGLLIFSFQMKSPRMLILMQIGGTLCFTLHFALIGAVSGAAMNAAGAVRAILIYLKGKNYKFASHPIVLIFIMAMFLGCGIVFYESVMTILITVAMLTTSVGLWINTSNSIRYSMFVGSPLWIIHNAHAHSWSGVLTEVFNLTSIFIYYIRMYFEKRKLAKNESKEI